MNFMEMEFMGAKIPSLGRRVAGLPSCDDKGGAGDIISSPMATF
jgi:hypothetical protein